MNDSLPSPGYLRQSQIIPSIVPICHSTLWRWVKDGKFPKPVKLSDRVTAWRSADLRDWLAQHDVTASKAVH